MAERLEVYKCEACGNIVEVIHGGGGELVCCGDPMELLVENTVDAAKEKHIPVIEKVEGGVKVKVGDVPHPMEEKHYIEWIEIIADDKADRQFLNPAKHPKRFSKRTRRMSPPVNIVICMVSGKDSRYVIGKNTGCPQRSAKCGTLLFIPLSFHARLF